jgi:hypothetical protein
MYNQIWIGAMTLIGTKQLFPHLFISPLWWTGAQQA